MLGALLRSLCAGDEAFVIAVADAVDLLVEAVLRRAELGRHPRLLAVPIPAHHRPRFVTTVYIFMCILSLLIKAYLCNKFIVT